MDKKTLRDPTWTAKMFDENKALRLKVKELEAALKSNTDAYSRGWVDALAEAHQWSNPTTALKENDDV